jgi:hypothetical protein
VALESVYHTMTRVLQWLGINASLCADDDLVDPSLCTYMQGLDQPDLSTIMNGEDVRSYFANLGQVERPVSIVTPDSLNAPSTEYNIHSMGSVFSSIIGDRMAQAAEKAAMLEGTEGELRTFSHRLYNLKDTRLESMLFDNPETLALLSTKSGFAGSDMSGIDPSSDAVLDEVSFFRISPVEQMWSEQRQADRMARLNVYPMHPMLDYAYANMAEEYADNGWNASQIALHVGQVTFYNILVHEMGHCIGMRHNFAGSIDYKNYHDGYWDIADEYPWPQPDAFNEDLAELYDNLTFEETVAFSRDVQRVDDERDLAGINKYQSSSVMDYTLNYIYDEAGMSKYDSAYMDFMYAGKVEAYVGDPRATSPSGTRRWEQIDPRGFEKTHWVYYAGGEECHVNSDCPFGRYQDEADVWHNGPRWGEISDEQIGAGVTQVCKVHPRLPTDASDPDVLPRVCSNFDDDFYDMIRTAPSTGAPYFQVKYMFCSDERTGDISWCNRFDRGSSFREVIRNWADYYDKAYPFSWFRRYRRLYGGASFWSTMTDMVKIYQHWLYRYYYEPGYSELRGPLYSEDQYIASMDALNFFARVIGTPDVGSYDLDPTSGNYYKVSDEMGEGDLDVPLGMGKWMYSGFQDGPMGVYELERFGLHWDKIYALLAMAVRDWNLMYSYDERFTINFYSLFDWEVMRLFGGVIRDEPTLFGPRWYTDPTTSETSLYYPQIWSGTYCGLYGLTCPDEYYDDYLDGAPAFENGTNEIIRNFAAVFSLAEFPIFYDTSYEQQLFVCERGSGYCFDICEEGSTAYFCGDPSYELTRGTDYETYTSDRLHKTFQAVSYKDIDPWADPPAVDNSMELLRKANDLQDALRTLEAHEAAGTCPPEMTAPCDEELEAAIVHASYKLAQHESFLINLMDIQREYGITSWL